MYVPCLEAIEKILIPGSFRLLAISVPSVCGSRNEVPVFFPIIHGLVIAPRLACILFLAFQTAQVGGLAITFRDSLTFSAFLMPESFLLFGEQCY